MDIYIYIHIYTHIHTQLPPYTLAYAFLLSATHTLPCTSAHAQIYTHTHDHFPPHTGLADKGGRYPGMTESKEADGGPEYTVINGVKVYGPRTSGVCILCGKEVCC